MGSCFLRSRVAYAWITMVDEDKKAAAEEKKTEGSAPVDQAKAGLDEEDEFEEFDEPDWETPVTVVDAKQWEEDWDDAGWDDEDQDDSFQKKLKEELERMSKK